MMIPSLLCSVLIAPLPLATPDPGPAAARATQDVSADTFMAAMEGAGLIEELRQQGSQAAPITLLRPGDAAFSALSPELMTSLFDADNRRPLRELLLRHVLVGSDSAVEYLQRGAAPVRSGESISVALESGGLRFGGAPVLAGPLVAKDPGEGFVIYEIGAVIGFDAQDFQRSPAQRLAKESLDAAASLPESNGPGSAGATVLTLGLRSILELEPNNSAAEFALSLAPAERTPARLRAALKAIRDGLTATAMKDDSLALIQFEKADGEPSWFTLNDDVMGGISESRFSYTEAGTGVFTGALSLENNGGFASIRSNQRDYELDGYKGLRVRVRGDGREYGLSALAGDERGRVGSWRKRFMTTKDEWQTIDVPFSEMVLNVRGRQFPSVGPPQLDQVRSFSFIIGDKNTSPFRLEIDSVSAYR